MNDFKFIVNKPLVFEFFLIRFPQCLSSSCSFFLATPNLLQNDQYDRASTGDFAGTSIIFCYYADFLLK